MTLKWLGSQSEAYQLSEYIVISWFHVLFWRRTVLHFYKILLYIFRFNCFPLLFCIQTPYKLVFSQYFGVFLHYLHYYESGVKISSLIDILAYLI
jgi:hypothetical protein